MDRNESPTESAGLSATTARSRRRRWKDLRRSASAQLASSAVWLISLWPRWLLLTLAPWLGRLAWIGSGKQRRRARENLARAFGDRYSDRERRRITRKMFEHFATIGLDVLKMQRWGPAKTMQRVRVEGWDDVVSAHESALEGGHGVLSLTGHFGNWEFFGLLGCNHWRGRSFSIAKKYDHAGYNRIVKQIRSNLGVDTLDQSTRATVLIRRLRENGLVGILPDQDAKGVDGVFVDFYGSPAYTPSAPAKLSYKLQTPIVPTFTTRVGWGYRVDVYPMIDPAVVADDPEPIEALTRLWTEAFEQQIAKHPEQWVWMHRRWHTTPEILQRRQARRRS